MQNTEKALMFARQNEVRKILLVGGEPTMHPDIFDLSALVKNFGFDLSVTTNYDFPETVEKLDGTVDRFNISYYGQKVLPNQKDFNADLIFSVLLWENRFKSIEEFDAFIEKYEKQFKTIKFSTLTDCNEWTAARKDVSILRMLNDVKPFKSSHGKEIGVVYKGHNILSYGEDDVKGYKVHVDGTISTSFDRNL